ncbi:MAG: 16S rRNA (adenine(1518)-N(6)/adenine(1519)-N(6))-dimethyltransferase RsmA [Clostridia bacterium]|nr:16S rRNA (adenine(1518)-N(6)/adenine(1519)-N(6))-dimethyltransferase RsmA [Clostridia bacterium]
MRANTKEILQKFNIKLTKSLGQNFLTDDNIVGKIIDTAEIAKTDLVIEVGPGIGNMTRELAKRAGKVAAIEIDKHLIPALKENLNEFTNVDIINEDVLNVDIKRLTEDIRQTYDTELKNDKVKVVANLPYYITTPIIMKFLEEDPGIDMMVLMVQKEVGERIAAKPGGKDYGALSVAVQYYAKPETVLKVPPGCFIPQPEVDSVVIRLKVFDQPPVKLLNKDIFFKTVKASFGQRRKTLINALSNSGQFHLSKEEIKQILESIGVDEKQRGETLTIEQFARLANAFSGQKRNQGFD